MKKTILSLLLTAGVALPAMAQLNGNGYYRIENYMTQRWVYVCDNKAWESTTGTTVNVEALRLWKNLEKAVPEASTVIYIEQQGSGYDLRNQGTGVAQLVGMTAKITPRSGVDNAYNIHGTRSGMTKYLADGQTGLSWDEGAMRDNGTPSRENSWWRFFAISPTDPTNYYGIQPTVNSPKGWFGTVYASFPMDFYSEGMEAYYVTRVADGQAVYAQLQGGIAPNTPVIIKCAGENPTNNRMNLLVSGGNAPESSMLRGVYFCNDVWGPHFNCLTYDPATMRLLGLTSQGDLGFITPTDVQYVPANSAYLVVPAGTPAELKLVTEDEFVAGVDRVVSDAEEIKAVVNGLQITLSGVKDGQLINVYSTSGALVATSHTPTLTAPSRGLYIIETGSTAIKVIL